MKSSHINKIKFPVLIVLLFLTQWVHADTGFDDDVQDVPEAPIDNWIESVLIVGLVVLFFYFRKRQAILK